MNFANEFVEEIRVKRNHLLSLLGKHEPNKIELNIEKQLLPHWHALPIVSGSKIRELSVDSSSAKRTLVNGVDLFIARALMLGSDGSRFKKIEFNAMRGITDQELALKLEIIFRDLIEIQIIVENSSELANDIVLVDGNLYGRYTHLMKQFNIRGVEHLPLLLFESMQKMFNVCSKKGVKVIGVSKFSKTRALNKALLAELGYSKDALDMPDVDMLYRYKLGEKGFTTPLILGEYAFADEAKVMLNEPKKYLQRYFYSLPRELWDWGISVIEQMPTVPAIIMFHVIPEVNEQPLRIDIPVNCLGMKDRMIDVSPFKFSDPYIVEDVLQQLLSDRGGRDVYNALLYVVDREVRLSPYVVDTIYKSILGNELKMPIEYDRSTRRFHL